MEIIENDTSLLVDFVSLNEQWISKYFEIEKSDLDLAKDPEKIIRDGGYVFFLKSGGQVQGVCALFKEGKGVYELARMAVSPASQGKGFGGQLLKAAIDKATSLKASRLYLTSNTKLEAAIALYRKHGFKTESLGEHPVYKRANIVMSYDFS